MKQLVALAKLARQLRESRRRRDRILCASVGLDESDVDDCFAAAKALDFERAAFLRDQLVELKELPQLVIAGSKRKKRDFLAAKRKG